jgi:hypothetical protein
MPFRWVIRRDLQGRVASRPTRSHVEGAIVPEPGLRSVEQCVSALLIHGETCEGTSGKRPIFKAGTLVGYIEIELTSQLDTTSLDSTRSFR